MKMTTEDFEFLKKHVEAYLKAYPKIVSQYEKGDFPRSGQVKNLQTRFAFDVFHIINWQHADGILSKRFTPYLEDSHVLTALNKIVPKVTRKY